MKRWLIISAALVLVCAGFWFTWLRPKPPKHYIIIVCDALRADHLGCYGDQRKVTPNIDAFAANNLLFTKAYSVAPWTFPSNGAMFTGIYPHQVCDSDAAMLVDQAVTMAEYFKQAGFKTAAFSAQPIISKRWKFDQGFDTFSNADGSADKTLDEQVANRGLVWLADHWQDKTFLLLYFYSPHEPYRPMKISNELKARLKGLRPDIAKGIVPLLASIRKPIIVDKVTDPKDVFHCSQAEIDALHDLYYGCINDDDRRIGQVLKAVGDDPETVVALMSDHGEEWLDHKGLRHKEMLYQELLHIPLILRIPGEKARAIATPVSNIDLLPTLLGLAGIKPKITLPGKSLLETGDDDIGRALFSGSYHSGGWDKLRKVKPFKIERYAIRQDNKALIHSLSGWADDPVYPEGGLWEYFDLESDPTEQVPLPRDITSGNMGAQLLDFEKFAKQQAKQQGNISERELKEKLKDMKNLGYLGK